jgi:hypothetical protein
MRVLCVVLLLSSTLVGCGRTPEPVVACPAPAESCDDLLVQQAELEAVYVDAASQGSDVGAAARRESAGCVQLLTNHLLDLGCVDRCDELCRLHPCAVLDDNGNRLAPTACPERCNALLDDQSLVADDLPLVIDKAAENPGFCTCRACVSEDDAFCTQLFDCALSAN